ncbi:hypothetical protein TOPH_02916, partial [Tolypocladium ophioglossoides CBS 100239]
HLLTDKFLYRCFPNYSDQIKCFTSRGGLDLRDYRTSAEAQDGMSSSQSSLRRRKRLPTKRSSRSPSKSNQHLIDYDIFPDGYEYPDGRLPPEPENMDEILHALARPRASLSPSRFTKDDFRKFKRADTHASKEREVTTTVIPVIEGEVKGPDGSLAVATRQACYDGALGARGIHSLQSYKQLEPQYDNNAYTITQGTILNHDFNLPPSYESDTSADKLSREFHPPKRSKSHSPQKRP